ncbi:hypothetical protein B7494_g6857 [Chlorociboria aeruginascens]|nr:hypothetical protein B7494_g6857 [Chlorociboria aeruginascens]
MGSIEVLSADRCEPGSFPLRMAKLPTPSTSEITNANIIASEWVSNFNKIVIKPDLDVADMSNLFASESFWRDHLCLSWDFHTLEGPQKIIDLLKGKDGLRIKSFAIDQTTAIHSPTTSVVDQVNVVQSFLTVDTDIGHGTGLVRLVDENGTWKVYTLFTTLKELKGHEESVKKRRPLGVQHGTNTSRGNWVDNRRAEENYGNDEPTVLIVGAGQGGLTIAARLKMLGVKSLIIDRNERVGDNWRNRYHQLVLHDCIWFDHLPYLSFPDNWPVFTPKDKLADWLENYVKVMELNAWTGTDLIETSWDEASAKWTVILKRMKDGKTETRVFHPKHIIQATGASGVPNFPDINGISSFSGAITHSSKFKGATPSQGQKKRVIIVGCCNSAHDIAQEFYENGHSVTLVQRSSTLVISAETQRENMAALWSDDAPPTEDSDILLQSIPNQVLKYLGVSETNSSAKADKKILQGLSKAGFKLDGGPDGGGLWIKYLQRGGGYYLDVGCSQLIGDGKISIKQGVEISEILPNGLKFSDGEVLEADEIVFATGYKNMRTQCRAIFGDEVADKVKDVWGFDQEGEIRTLWRSSGHKGFWFMGGNLALCRYFSRLLALQIKAREQVSEETIDPSIVS